MAAKPLRIGRQTVGQTAAPFIIAEMSGNHNQSLDRALRIVDAAAKAGAHALKIQTYTADTMTLNVRSKEFLVRDKKSLWKGSNLYDLYKRAYTPWEWHAQIFARCRKRGIIGFSTPFDETAVDFLESLNVPCYKIASFENIDLPLIRRVARTGKPLIISTGMATLREISEAVKTARQNGCRQLLLMKCTSAYPAPPSDSHLQTIPDMRRQFKCPIGLSDHTLGNGASIAAVSLGAVAVERHFTLKRSDGGVDSAFSLQPEELARLVQESRDAWQAQGRVFYGPTAREKGSLIFRRSLYVSEDMAKGETFTEANVRRVRPGYGMPPKHYSNVLGRRSKRALRKGTPLHWDLIH